jgi:hypothetical protein
LILLFLHELLYRFGEQLKRVYTEHFADVIELLLCALDIVFVEFDPCSRGELLD